ncbi:TadE family type IV pilus minor pilin [Granulicoccus sp. GXG6511]|uniref:TadE family type IV pilus minor pilin n=1 Tax=Granulicoccus sp. GXG6511 TaxID=3381351 RepID=UPI003D7EDE73
MKQQARGMVTVELALALIGLALATLVGMWFVWMLGQQIRCADTAREVARQLARGDDTAAHRAAQAGPRGSAVSSERRDGDAVVIVRLRARPFDRLPAVPLEATARVALEPGVQ